MRLRDRWWVWTEEHPSAWRVGVLALVAALAGLIVGGDFVLTWTCAHGFHAACLVQAQP